MNDLFSDQAFSVSAITSLIKQTLEGAFYGISIEGEISNFRPAASGHWYFQLNDVDAAIQAVMFKQKNWKLPFLPKDGDRVRVTGNISVYAQRGSYQILCDSIEKMGTGDILALLEQRKREFAAKGYFNQEKKRVLPPYPKRICIVTSPTGAAVRDILQVLERRNPSIDVIVLPAIVQGAGAAQTIANQIIAANRWKLGDVIIVGRGGGSLEDLLPFSEQSVIEAIVQSSIPVVSAVGHEIDWALSDFAADLRAPTPSAAAELVSLDYHEIHTHLQEQMAHMAHLIEGKIALAKSRTAVFTPIRMSEYFSRRLELAHLRSDDLQNQISQLIKNRIQQSRHMSSTLSTQIMALSPLAVLDRGYALVTQLGTDFLVTQSTQLSEEDHISIRFSKGSATATIQSIEPDNT